MGGGIWRAASDFIDLRVEEPYLSMKINMTAVERGKKRRDALRLEPETAVRRNGDR